MRLCSVFLGWFSASSVFAFICFRPQQRGPTAPWLQAEASDPPPRPHHLAAFLLQKLGFWWRAFTFSSQFLPIPLRTVSAAKLHPTPCRLSRPRWRLRSTRRPTTRQGKRDSKKLSKPTCLHFKWTEMSILYSLVTAIFSSRSWYRTWNSAAYHHWDPKQTVSYEVFFIFLSFLFGGFRYLCWGRRRGRTLRGLESSEHVSTASGSCICIWLFTLRNIICINEKYTCAHTHTHTHTHTYTQKWYDKQWWEGWGGEVCCYGSFFFYFYWHAKTPQPLWIVKDSGSGPAG